MNPSNSDADVELREKLRFYQYPGTSQGIELTPDHLDHIMQLIQTERAQAAAEAYEACETWLNGRLTSKADVSGICRTRKKVLRGEMDAPTSRFAPSNPEQPKEDP